MKSMNRLNTQGRRVGRLYGILLMLSYWGCIVVDGQFAPADRATLKTAVDSCLAAGGQENHQNNHPIEGKSRRRRGRTFPKATTTSSSSGGSGSGKVKKDITDKGNQKQNQNQNQEKSNHCCLYFFFCGYSSGSRSCLDGPRIDFGSHLRLRATTLE